MKHFNWMVIDHVNRQGIWFWGTCSHLTYVWYWNPLVMLDRWMHDWKNCSFGWFPMLRSHIR